MPRDLFGDVTRPSISVGNRKWYTVPVSLLSHTIVIAMIVIVPLLAAPMMPGVFDNNTIYRFMDLVPPTPPPAPKRADAAPKPIEQPGVPIKAPDGFTKEPDTLVEKDVDVIGVPGGVIDAARDLAPPPVVKPPEPQLPVRVGGTIRAPMKIRGNEPVYPQFAILSKTQGIVIIEATLGPDGRMMNARILKSIPLLDQAALDAVRSWEYTPTLLNGVPVPVIMTVTVMFTLSK